MTQALNELGAHIEVKRPDCVIAWDVTHGELNVDVAPANIAGLVEFLRADPTCRFSTAANASAPGTIAPGGALSQSITLSPATIRLARRVRSGRASEASPNAAKSRPGAERPRPARIICRSASAISPAPRTW